MWLIHRWEKPREKLEAGHGGKSAKSILAYSHTVSNNETSHKMTNMKQKLTWMGSQTHQCKLF